MNCLPPEGPGSSSAPRARRGPSTSLHSAQDDRSFWGALLSLPSVFPPPSRQPETTTARFLAADLHPCPGMSGRAVGVRVSWRGRRAKKICFYDGRRCRQYATHEPAGRVPPSGKFRRRVRPAGPFPRLFHFPSLVFIPMIRFRPLPSLLPVALAGSLWPAAAPQAQAQSRIVTTTQTEVVRRQNLAAASTENLRRGDADMIRQDYEQAMREYRLAVDSLPDAPATQDRRDAAMHKFFDATMKLAEQRITEGRYVDAETTVKVILRPEYNPQLQAGRRAAHATWKTRTTTTRRPARSSSAKRPAGQRTARRTRAGSLPAATVRPRLQAVRAGAHPRSRTTTPPARGDGARGLGASMKHSEGPRL